MLIVHDAICTIVYFYDISVYDSVEEFFFTCKLNKFCNSNVFFAFSTASRVLSLITKILKIFIYEVGMAQYEGEYITWCSVPLRIDLACLFKTAREL